MTSPSDEDFIQAFPAHFSFNQGMTLRDYFAAKALQGLLANPKLAQHILKAGGAHSGWIEDASYGWADAMLRARDAKT